MEKIFYLEGNRKLSLFTEHDNFITNNPAEIISRFYSVFRLSPNNFYTESCKNSEGQIALFEREIDALDFGIDYVRSRFGALNDSPIS